MKITVYAPDYRIADVTNLWAAKKKATLVASQKPDGPNNLMALEIDLAQFKLDSKTTPEGYRFLTLDLRA